MDDAGAAEDAGRVALSVFDFSRNLVEIWRGSNWEARHELLERVSSNRTLSDVTIALTKREPFDVPAEGRKVKNGRRDGTTIELFLKRSCEVEVLMMGLLAE